MKASKAGRSGGGFEVRNEAIFQLRGGLHFAAQVAEVCLLMFD